MCALTSPQESKKITELVPGLPYGGSWWSGAQPALRRAECFGDDENENCDSCYKGPF